MFKKYAGLSLFLFLLIGCSSGGASSLDTNSTEVITKDSLNESNSESSTSLIPQTPSRETILAINRCIKSSDSAVSSLEFYFGSGEITSLYIEAVQQDLKLASTDCEEASLQAKTDDLKQLIWSIDDYVQSIQFTKLDVDLLNLSLLSGAETSWDPSFTPHFKEALALFLKKVSEFGITIS